MNQGFWMAKGSECLNDGEMTYDNSSRIDPKRSHSHQWFMDGPEAELFPNKKQAVGVPTNNLFSGLLNPSVPAWGHPSSFHSLSAPFSERLFDSPTARAVNFDDRNLTSVNADKIDPGRKVSDDLFGNDSTFGLSMSQTLEDHRAGLSYGIRKVKVSQVKDSENVMAVSMGHGYDTVDSNTISMAQAYSKPDDSSISMGLAYNKGDDNIMSMGDTFVRENNIFISMGQPYNKGNDNIPIGQTYKENSDSIQMAHTYSKGDNNMISMGQTYKVDDNTISMGHIYNKGDEGTISMVHTYNKDDNNTLSIGQSYNKGESTIISFGGYDDDDANPSGTLLPTYGMMTGQSSVHTSEVLNQKALAKSNADTLISSENVTVSGAENNSRKKEDLKTSKKAPSNNFPSNVRSLLSTGMLDGVPVKYIAWSREKELRGVIKGSGYQCSCQSCNYSKVINAYEFERHAGCKTKHPNNHIYFDNGKTIYGIVQELRSTPQNMLFEVIQTITGSPINQKCFRLWKESFLAATRELQRIYGKEEGKQLS